jgi:hypothetical protein
VTIPGDTQPTPDAFSFWQAFYKHIKPEGEPFHSESTRFAQEQEESVRQFFLKVWNQN